MNSIKIEGKERGGRMNEGSSEGGGDVGSSEGGGVGSAEGWRGGSAKAGSS